MGKIVFLKIVFYFKIENTILFSIFKIVLKSSVENMCFDPGSLNRATGEKVTVSEVNRVFRGTGNRQSVLGSWGAFCSSRGSSKMGYYFTYFLLHSAHHYPIPYSLTSPKDWRRVKLQERSRNRGQGSK